MRCSTAFRAALGGLAAAAVIAAIVVPLTVTSGGSSQPRHGDPLAMLQEYVNLLARPEPTLQTLRSIGVDVVRAQVVWGMVAPDPSSRTPPAGFNASDPAQYPAANWAPYDAVVKDAWADGVKLNFVLTGGAPQWALGQDAPPSRRSSGAWKPSAAAYGQFVQAVATRYSGRYTPPGASSPLPPVRFWELWNEPNWGVSLEPQMALHPLRIVAAPVYRDLLDAAWNALKRTGAGRDTIITGGLSPRGITVPPDTALAAAINVSSPIGFTQTLYCVDSAYRPLRGGAASQAGCPTTDTGSQRFRQAHPALFDATGYGLHPYPVSLPPTQSDSSGAGTVEFSEIPKLTSALDRIQSVYGSDKKLSVYNTEFGYVTHPPNTSTGYVSPPVAARYINWAEYLSWRNPRLATTMQYLLYDPAPGPSAFGNGGFATGLLFFNGIPKATFAAYRMPIFLPVTKSGPGHSLEVWGAVRPAQYASLDTHRAQQVQIQFRIGSIGPFHALKTVPITDPRGYFDVPVRFPASGTVRLTWSYPPGDQRLVDPVTPQDTTIYSRPVQITVQFWQGLHERLSQRFPAKG
jgi:hypothetical protein